MYNHSATPWNHQVNEDFFLNLSHFDFFEKLIVVKTCQNFSKEIRMKVEKYVQENQSIFLEDLHEFFESYGLGTFWVIDTLQALYWCHQIGGQIWEEAQKWFQSHKDHMIKNIKNSFAQNESENLTIASLCLCFQNEAELQNLARNYIDKFVAYLTKYAKTPSKKPVETFTYALIHLIWFDFLK